MRHMLAVFTALASALLHISSASAVTQVYTGTYDASQEASVGMFDPSLGLGRYSVTLSISGPIVMYNSFGGDSGKLPLVYTDFYVDFLGFDPAYGYFPTGGGWDGPLAVTMKETSPNNFVGQVGIYAPWFCLSGSICPDGRGGEYVTSITQSGREWGVGVYTDAGFWADVPGTWTVTITSVPEPLAWSLMMMGVGMVGMGLRRRATDRRLQCSASLA